MTTEARPDLEARARMLAHELLGLVPGRADETDPAFVCVMAYVLEAERREASLKDEVKHWHDVVVGDGEEIAALRAEREVLQRERDEANRQCSKAICERDHLEELAGDMVVQAGLECEWTNLHGHVDCVGEAFAVLRKERDTALADLAAARAERDGARQARLRVLDRRAEHEALAALRRRVEEACRGDDEATAVIREVANDSGGYSYYHHRRDEMRHVLSVLDHARAAAGELRGMLREAHSTPPGELHAFWGLPDVAAAIK